MNSTHRQVPEWKAPESLLPNVLSAVAARTSLGLSGFFAWSLPRRAAFVAAAAAALLLVAGWPLGIGWSGPGAHTARTFTILRESLTLFTALWGACATVGRHALRHPLVVVSSVCMGGLVMATWVADIHLMARMLVPNQRRIAA